MLMASMMTPMATTMMESLSMAKPSEGKSTWGPGVKVMFPLLKILNWAHTCWYSFIYNSPSPSSPPRCPTPTTPWWSWRSLTCALEHWLWWKGEIVESEADAGEVGCFLVILAPGREAWLWLWMFFLGHQIVPHCELVSPVMGVNPRFQVKHLVVVGWSWISCNLDELWCIKRNMMRSVIENDQMFPLSGIIGRPEHWGGRGASGCWRSRTRVAWGFRSGGNI